jgi:transglutaminase 1
MKIILYYLSPDDEGLLLGNWTNDFSGGVAPTKWAGSVEIMQRYWRKRRPVKVVNKNHAK